MARGFEIGPERFFQNHSRPASFARLVQAGFLQILHDRFELLGRGGEIKKTIAARAALLIEAVETFRQLLVALLVAEFALMIEERLGEAIPDFVAHGLPGEIPGRFLHFMAELLVRLGPAGEADHRDRRWHLAVRRDVVERGHEFAVSEVAGRAENDDGARLRQSLGRESFAQRIGLRLVRHDVVAPDGPDNLRRSMRAR